jgi:hypothetical protein
MSVQADVDAADELCGGPSCSVEQLLVAESVP